MTEPDYNGIVPRQAQESELAAGDPDRVEVTPGVVVRFVGADYAGSLFAIGASSILPVIVLATLGATSSAHFYIVSLIATAAQLVPTVLATSQRSSSP